MPVQCINFPFGFIFLFHTFGAFSKLFIDIYVFYAVKLSIFITFLSVEMWKLSHLTEFNNSFSRFRIRLLIERVRGRVVCGCRVPNRTHKRRNHYADDRTQHVPRCCSGCFPVLAGRRHHRQGLAAEPLLHPRSAGRRTVLFHPQLYSLFHGHRVHQLRRDAANRFYDHVLHHRRLHGQYPRVAQGQQSCHPVPCHLHCDDPAAKLPWRRQQRSASWPVR